MEQTQKIEEALSIVWEEKEKQSSDARQIRNLIVEQTKTNLLDELVKKGYISLEKDVVDFKPKGEAIARDMVRRQRLAERLLIDVLEVGRGEMDSAACEFEHILSKEVEESICTLLGHPKECPHGLAIPAGKCCQKAKDLLESIVIPLSKLKAGEAGKVVYVLTRKHPQLHKLMSLGITPGARILVHQTFPAVVVKVEETQVALEQAIAKEIYVKNLHEPK